MPEKTLKALADHGKIAGPMAIDGGDAEAVLAKFKAQGIDVDALATQLQKEGGASFSKSWGSLLDGLRDKTSKLATAGSK